MVMEPGGRREETVEKNEVWFALLLASNYAPQLDICIVNKLHRNALIQVGRDLSTLRHSTEPCPFIKRPADYMYGIYIYPYDSRLLNRNEMAIGGFSLYFVMQMCRVQWREKARERKSDTAISPSFFFSSLSSSSSRRSARIRETERERSLISENSPERDPIALPRRKDDKTGLHMRANVDTTRKTVWPTTGSLRLSLDRKDYMKPRNVVPKRTGVCPEPASASRRTHARISPPHSPPKESGKVLELFAEKIDCIYCRVVRPSVPLRWFPYFCITRKRRETKWEKI